MRQVAAAAVGAPLVVGVDLGKSGCRATALPANWRTPAHDTASGSAAFRMFARTGSGPGASGLAEPGGVAAGVAAISAVLDPLLRRQRAAGLAVGAAGGAADSEAAATLAAVLAERYRAPVAVSHDALTSHLGALSGRPGVVLAAGTGAVAFGVAADGRTSLVDGWGQWLGDDGGGTWIGRTALQAVLRARDGRGPATALTAPAAQRYGDLARLPRTLPVQPSTVGATAAFVPDVISCAGAGDQVARDVLTRAGHLLAESTATAAAVLGTGDRRRVEAAVVGGLAAGGLHIDTWRSALPENLQVVPAEGDAAMGALLLVTRTDLPHEAHVWRQPGKAA